MWETLNDFKNRWSYDKITNLTFSSFTPLVLMEFVLLFLLPEIRDIDHQAFYNVEIV